MNVTITLKSGRRIELTTDELKELAAALSAPRAAPDAAHVPIYVGWPALPAMPNTPPYPYLLPQVTC